MKYEKRICEFCKGEFVPNVHNQKYCKREVCQKFRKMSNENKERYLQNHKNFQIDANLVANLEEKYATKKHKKNSLKQEISNIHQPLYQVKKGINLIKKLDKIHENMVKYMNILKLDTYPEEIKNHCIYIMKESNRFLQNQLKLDRDKGVIIVQKE